MKKLLIASALVLVAAPAFAQQTRYYDSRGKSFGTSSTNSSGTTTLYDSCGNVNTFMRKLWPALLCRCSPQKLRCEASEATPTASLP
jgi:hypothetical protein